MPSLLFPRLLRLPVLLLLAATAMTPARAFEPVSGPSAAARRPRLLLHGGVSGIFDTEQNPAFALEYRWGASKAGLTPWLAAGWATDGATIFGAGLSHTWTVGKRAEVGVGFGPGYYDRHEGRDLGSHLEFYSFAEVSWALVPAHRLVLRIAHISNGSLAQVNPGTELLTLGYSFDLR